MTKRDETILPVFVEVAHTATAGGGVELTGRLQDRARKAAVDVVELPEEIYPKLGTTAGRIANAIRDGMSPSLRQGVGEVTVRFGLTFTGSLGLKIVGASAESAVSVEVKWSMGGAGQVSQGK